MSEDLFAFRRQRRIREQLHDAIIEALENAEGYKRPRSVRPYLDCEEIIALLDHVNCLEGSLRVTNQALDALAATLELHAEEPWQVEAHGVACSAWRVTEDALGRTKVDA